MTWNLAIFCRDCNANIVLEKLQLDHAEFMLQHAADTGHKEFGWAITTSVGGLW